MDRELLGCFDYEYLCDQCRLVRQAHEDADDASECFVSWFEFINVEDLWPLLYKWWETVDPEYVKGMAEQQLRVTVARMSDDKENAAKLRALLGWEG